MSRLLRPLADLLLPAVCSCCGMRLEPGERVLCGACRQTFEPLGRLLCPVCSAWTQKKVTRRCPKCPPAPIHFSRALSVCRYAGRLPDTFHAYKYNGYRELGETLGRLMYDFFVEHYEPGFFGGNDSMQGRLDVVTPVPLHYTRRWRRGYNQSEILGRAFCIRAGLRFETGLMARTRRTPRQALLPPGRREENVRGAFEVIAPNAVRGRRIGLFDDILTTCHTANECARMLRDAGAADVVVFAFARA